MGCISSLDKLYSVNYNDLCNKELTNKLYSIHCTELKMTPLSSSLNHF